MQTDTKYSSKTEKQTASIQWAKSLIDQARGKDFFGTLEIKFEGGEAVFARNIMTLKPPKEEA